jgi:hypothetical protein
MASTSYLRHHTSARTGLALETVSLQPAMPAPIQGLPAFQSAALMLASTRSTAKAPCAVEPLARSFAVPQLAAILAGAPGDLEASIS